MQRSTITGKFVSTKPKYNVPALEKGIRILFYLKDKPDASLTDIYTALGFPKSSTFQILSILQFHGLVRRSEDSGRYSLGLRLFELGNVAVLHVDVAKVARPILESLVERTGQTAQLAILDEHEVVYIDKLEGSYGSVIKTWIGQRGSLHATGSGKVFLAWSSPDELQRLLSGAKLKRMTEKTITSAATLRSHLVEWKERGHMMNDEETQPHVRSVAVPVFGADGVVVAAISLAGFAQDFAGRRLEGFVVEAKRAADELSARLRGD